jgi:uncharacterized membrane protein
MNLRRGLLRLGIVLAIAWVMGINTARHWDPNNWENNVRAHLEWALSAFSVPVAVLIIGAAVCWAAVGFRKK